MSQEILLLRNNDDKTKSRFATKWPLDYGEKQINKYKYTKTNYTIECTEGVFGWTVLCFGEKAVSAIAASRAMDNTCQLQDSLLMSSTC